jgi:nifR3 family TIM-barrel protein
MDRTAALHIGPIEVWPPVVLAPMAGVTNPPFRRLCRRFGAGLYVSEMITARGLVEGGTGTWERAAFDADESPRSIQLYGSDPVAMGEAVRLLVGVGHVDHIDLNLGCPVRKITRHGGGSALTCRPRLLEALVQAAVDAATTESVTGTAVPVTMKFRLGIDGDVLTYLDAGRVAEATGCAAIALHGRTAAQLYSGTADWSAIEQLKRAVTTIPVLGNGDIWSAHDATRMMEETGCDGVVIGRGCLGRPWLFRDLVEVFEGREVAPPPALGAVIDTLAEHLDLLVDHMGPTRALQDVRKHVGWYLTGYPVGGVARRKLTTTGSIEHFHEILAHLDRSMALPVEASNRPRGTQRGPQKVALPDGWLADRDSAVPPGRLADALTSGG